MGAGKCFRKEAKKGKRAKKGTKGTEKGHTLSEMNKIRGFLVV